MNSLHEALIHLKTNNIELNNISIYSVYVEQGIYSIAVKNSNHISNDIVTDILIDFLSSLTDLEMIEVVEYNFVTETYRFKLEVI